MKCLGTPAIDLYQMCTKPESLLSNRNFCCLMLNERLTEVFVFLQDRSASGSEDDWSWASALHLTLYFTKHSREASQWKGLVLPRQAEFYLTVVHLSKPLIKKHEMWSYDTSYLNHIPLWMVASLWLFCFFPVSGTLMENELSRINFSLTKQLFFLFLLLCVLF